MSLTDKKQLIFCASIIEGAVGGFVMFVFFAWEGQKLAVILIFLEDRIFCEFRRLVGFSALYDNKI